MTDQMKHGSTIDYIEIADAVKPQWKRNDFPMWTLSADKDERAYYFLHSYEGIVDMLKWCHKNRGKFRFAYLIECCELQEFTPSKGFVMKHFFKTPQEACQYILRAKELSDG